MSNINTYWFRTWQKLAYNNYIHHTVKIGEGTKLKRNIEIRANVRIGKNCYIDSGCIFTGGSTIGNKVTIRNNCVIARGSFIGDNCFLSPQTMFANLDTHGNKIGGAQLSYNVFVGTNVTFHHGVTVAPYSIIASKSFVNKDINEPNRTWGGVPAKLLK